MSAESESETPAKPLSGEAAEPSMEYFRAWTYLFEAPSWQNDWLMASLCSLIPIVGKIIVDGFLWERGGVASGELAGPHQAFSFEHLGRYLPRGIWPFVVSTLLNIVGYALIGLAVLLVIVGARFIDLNWLASFSERELTIWFYAIGTPLLLLILAIAKLLILIGISQTIHSERSCEFAAVFHFGFLCGFISRIWVEGILVITFIGIVAPLVVTLGLLCCVVGVVPAMVLSYAANEFLFWRLYKLYLARGGAPVPIRAVT